MLPATFSYGRRRCPEQVQISKNKGKMFWRQAGKEAGLYNFEMSLWKTGTHLNKKGDVWAEIYEEIPKSIVHLEKNICTIRKKVGFNFLNEKTQNLFQKIHHLSRSGWLGARKSAHPEIAGFGNFRQSAILAISEVADWRTFLTIFKH